MRIKKDAQQKIIKLYEDGMSSIKIAKLFNVSKTTILNVFKNNNIKTRPSYSVVILLKDENDILNLYKNGKSTREIAKLYKISPTAVLNFLKNKNIDRRSPNRDYEFDEHFLDIIDMPEKAYIIGLYLADGYVHKNSLCIKLQEKDKEILLKIKKLFNATNSLTFINEKKRNENYSNSYCLSLSSKHLINVVSKFGIVKSKTFKVKFPKKIPVEFYPDLIRGYFDGDGCIYFNKKNRNFKFSLVGTLSFCNFIKCYIKKKFNIHCTISKSRQINNIRILSIGGNIQVKTIMNWLYKDALLYLMRKKCKYDSSLDIILNYKTTQEV